MSKGLTHDKVALWSTPIAFFASNAVIHAMHAPGTVNTPVYTGVVLASYTAGWVWFSPDIDLAQSLPSKRWGWLSGFWKYYRQASGHRGFSHLPIIGTLSRMLYLGFVVALIYALAGYDLIAMTTRYKVLFTPVFIGLELSAWVHLFCDYTPIIRKM